MSRRVGRDAVLSTVGLLLSGAAQLVVSIVVGRFAGPGTLGLVRGSLSLANTAGLLWPSSAGQAASLYIARESEAGRAEIADQVHRHLMVRTLQAVALLAPLGAGLSMLVLGLGAADAVWVAALVCGLAAYHVARGVRFGRGAVARATAWEAVNTVACLGLLAAVLAWRTPGWLLAPLVAGNLTYAASAWWPRTRTRLEPGLRKELDGFVRWGVAGTLASAGLLQLSMILAATHGPGAGDYAAALSLATPLSMAARAVSIALFPEMARQQGRADEDATRRSTDRATRGLVILLTPAFCSLIIVAHPLMVTLYGPGFEDAVLPLRVLLVAVFWSVVPVASVNSISVRGREGVRRSALLSWGGFILGIALMVTFQHPWGVVGVAAGYLAGVACSALAAHALVWRRDHHRWAALTCLVVVVPATCLATASAAQDLSGWTAGAVGVAILLVVWTGAVWVTGVAKPLTGGRSDRRGPRGTQP